MNKLIKVLSLAFLLSIVFVSCSKENEECKEGEKKECCSDKEASSESAEDANDESHSNDEDSHDH